MTMETFTQQDVNDAIQKRLAKAQRQHARLVHQLRPRGARGARSDSGADRGAGSAARLLFQSERTPGWPRLAAMDPES